MRVQSWLHAHAKIAEVAQQKGAFTLDDAAMVHDAKKLFVGTNVPAKDDGEGEGK